MSTPPDFLGMALGLINQNRQRAAQRNAQAQEAQQMQMRQQQFQMQADSQREQTRQAGLAEASTALKESGGDFNYAKSILEATTHGDYPSSYLEILKGGSKLIKKQVEENEKKQAVGQFGGAAAGEIGQRLRSLLDARAQGGFASPSDQQAFGEALASASRNFGGAAGPVIQAGIGEAQNLQTARQEQTLSREEADKFSARGQYRAAAIGDLRDSGNYLLPPATAASMGLKGQPGPNGLLVVPARNRAEQNRIMAAGGVQTGSASGISMGAGDVNVPTATQGKLFDTLEALGEQRRTMRRIGENYDPKYTEYLSQGGASISKFARKLGYKTSDEQDQFTAGYNSFKADLGNNLMAKIQQRAATTFTDRLYDRMRKWNLTEDLSDPEFRRLYKEISTELDLNYARTIYALKHDPVVAAEAEEKGEIPKKTREEIESRYTNERVTKMMRTVEQRAVAGAIRNGASDEEAAQAGTDAVEREFYEPGAQ